MSIGMYLSEQVETLTKLRPLGSSLTVVFDAPCRYSAIGRCRTPKLCADLLLESVYPPLPGIRSCRFQKTTKGKQSIHFPRIGYYWENNACGFRQGGRYELST